MWKKYQYSYMQFETHTSVYTYIYMSYWTSSPRSPPWKCGVRACFPSSSSDVWVWGGGLECGSGTKNFSSFAYFVLLSPCLKTLKTNGNTFLCGWVLGAIMGHLFFALSLSLSVHVALNVPFFMCFYWIIFCWYVCGETYKLPIIIPIISQNIPYNV